MDILNNLGVYELVQLYIVSEIVQKHDLSHVYSLLFQNVPPKNVNLSSIKYQIQVSQICMAKLEHGISESCRVYPPIRTCGYGSFLIFRYLATISIIGAGSCKILIADSQLMIATKCPSIYVMGNL